MTSKKYHPWQQEVEWAMAICAPHGCKVERSSAQYEIATVKGSGVSLVIYPHKTSAGNYHARVRDNGSKNRMRAGLVMAALHDGEGLPEDVAHQIRFSCTFTWKNMSLNDPVLLEARKMRLSNSTHPS